MYSRTLIRRLKHSQRIPQSNFICIRCLSTKIYNTASSRIQHLSQLRSTYDIVKGLKDIYAAADTTFIEDLSTKLAKSNDKDVELPLNILRNDSVNEYMLKDCCDIILKDDNVDLILNSFSLLQRVHILPLYEFRGKDINILRMEFLQVLINENHVSLATTCVLNFVNNKIKVPYSLIKLLVNVISSSSLKEFPMNAYCLLQILRISPSINPSELFTSLIYLSSNAHGNYFANYLFFKYVGGEMFTKMSPRQQHQVVISMLQVNLENSDSIKARKVWQMAKPIVLNHAPSLNLAALYVQKLIQTFQLHHNEALVDQELDNLPTCLDTDDMIDYKLFFYAQFSADKFNTLVKSLRSPLRRSSLTSLLRGFVQLRDEANAEKIMETIFTHSTINDMESQTIVEKLLQQGKVSEALSMIRRMNLAVTKSSYLAVFKHTWMNKDQALFRELYLKFMKLNRDDPILEQFTIELLRAISTTSNRQGVRYYTKFIKKVDFQPYKTNELYQMIDFKRYEFLDEFSQLLYLTPFGMIECVKILSKQALFYRDDISLRWCIEEFRKCGWDLTTIIEYLEYFDRNGYLRQTLKPRVFN
ncbi:hypothetical protein CANMA_002733 [Candida margitis]|uniref:uncharacterized protein n=1 Tax=Candida margitis TaxID=1775924 RepID=UPI0022268361|nr:uncharacterized protein CANMA_002733 [Candida margitis]KAI5967965.1 hypothetical protein CANMA_002733 [Candida margitis]